MLARTLCFAMLLVAVPACYQGVDSDKQPPPGYAGGFCLAGNPDPFCNDGSICELVGAYCYDPTEPCRGFLCGGEDPNGSPRGVCMPDAELKPTCACAPGFNNEMWDLYCCPNPEIGLYDELCGVPQSADAQASLPMVSDYESELDPEPDPELDPELDSEEAGD